MKKLTGEGVIIGVTDGVVDRTHPDISDRLVSPPNYALRGGSPEMDIVGHGTHVVGCISGDGTTSNGKIIGVAPNAKVYFQGVIDGNKGRIYNVHKHIEYLLQDAYDHDVRIHNNSWTYMRLPYEQLSQKVDEFMYHHPDYLFICSVGNFGHLEDGELALGTLGSPADAKNALTVGTACSHSLDGWQNTWARFRFYEHMIGQEPLSGNPNLIAPNSSRGPAFGRIKPDVIASGTNILAARSSTAHESLFWLMLGNNRHYAYLGGSSQATARVSGLAGLMTEYLIKTYQHQPSAALLKAFIIHTASPILDEITNDGPIPNNHQGYGKADLDCSFQSRHMIFFDDEECQVASQQEWKYELHVPPSVAAVKVTLVWMDPPGEEIVHPMVLALSRDSDHVSYYPNGFSSEKEIWMNMSNVQQITREVIEPGKYFVHIKAGHFLAKNAQRVALVVSMW